VTSIWCATFHSYTQISAISLFGFSVRILLLLDDENNLHNFLISNIFENRSRTNFNKVHSLFILARAFEGSLLTHDRSVPSLMADRHSQPRMENMRLHRKIRQLRQQPLSTISDRRMIYCFIIRWEAKFEPRNYAASLAVLANSHHERERPIESDVSDGSIAVLQVLVNWKKFPRFPTVSSLVPIASDNG
jgi:hypothetical protein